jgi:gas vesicle protein
MAGGTLAFLVASSIGAALGILFAPKAGSETRSDLAEKARQLAWRFKRSRAELQESVREIFGEVNDELEQAYVQVRSEVIADMESLEPDVDPRSVYRGMIRSAVRSAAKEWGWTKSQIENFIAHLEDEYSGMETDNWS